MNLARWKIIARVGARWLAESAFIVSVTVAVLPEIFGSAGRAAGIAAALGRALCASTNRGTAAEGT